MTLPNCLSWVDQEWKLLKMSSFKMTSFSKSRNNWISPFKTTTPRWKLYKISNFKMTTPSKSNDFSISVFRRLPHSSKVEIIQSQSFQDCHNLPKWYFPKTSPYKTTTAPQSEINLKSLLSGSPHSPKVNGLKSLLSRPPHPPKVKFIKIQSFQDHHILPKWTLSKVSPYKTTTPSQVKVIQHQ